MPSHSRTPPIPEPGASIDIPENDAPSTPVERPSASPRSRRDSDAIWVRIGDAEADRAASSAAADAVEPSEEEAPSPVSLADVESALDELGVEVDAIGVDAAAEAHDLQRVVDHYERLIAERERAIRDRGTADTRDEQGPDGGFVGALRSKLRAATEQLRR